MNKISLCEIEIENLLFLSLCRSIGEIQDLPVNYCCCSVACVPDHLKRKILTFLFKWSGTQAIAVKLFHDKFCPVNGDKDSSVVKVISF